MDFEEKFEIEKQRNMRVVKSNDLVRRARYELSTPELKVMGFLFSKIKPTDTELSDQIFSIQEYCKVAGIDYKNGKNYADIKKRLKDLRDKSFWIIEPDGTETTVGWIGKVWINRGSGKIRVRFDEDMSKYLLNLYKNYTQYSLLCTLPFTSVYSFRLYELLKSYAFQEETSIDLDLLKRLLGAEHYVKFKDFRKRVLEMAQKEINLYTDIEFVWDSIMKGKKVEKLRFEIFTKNAQQQFEANQIAESEIDGQFQFDTNGTIRVEWEDIDEE